MKSSRLFFALLAAIVALHSAAAAAATIDMDDPRRALGRENDIRVDAQLVKDTVSPGVSIGATIQISNLTTTPVAVADKVASASYDSDTMTITLSVGSEIPADGVMPKMTTIAPGQTKVFRCGAAPMINPAALRAAAGAAPRYVQIKVTVLRDLTPFERLLSEDARATQALSDELFDRWFESNDTIFLNSVPVRYAPRAGGFAGADQRDMSANGF
jgi:hypothetical protein